MEISYFYISLCFFLISLILYSLKTSLTYYQKSEIDKAFTFRSLSLLRWIKDRLLSKNLENVVSLIQFSLSLYLFGFFSIAFLTLFRSSLPYLSSSLLLLATLLIIGALLHIICRYATRFTLKATASIGSIFLYLLLPLSYLFITFQRIFRVKKDLLLPQHGQIKKQLLDILSTDAAQNLDSVKKHLLYSFAHFEDKSCREIMIPRIRLKCLQNTSSIFEAIALFIEEGFSRLPIFEKSIDHITGVLLYKDVLEYTFKKGLYDIESLKKGQITSLISPILYAPENKPISELLQVMRSRKIHGAIIVNEYGCTEGLVTIEDIFEELIGSEILDEHDEEDDLLYRKTHNEGWIVEANISIIDAEREFGIFLPHNPKYETIGGFISTTMGIIPKPGAIIHFDQYEIKVLSSNERKILKVKITLSSKQTK